MTVKVKKYGRWSEAGNWQLESITEKELSEDAYNQFVEFGGFSHSEKYNEFYAVSEDKLRMTVVIQK